MMQSLLSAIYPTLRSSFGLTFVQLGWLSLCYQLTASILQPVVGFYADRRPMPFSVPAGTFFTGGGLLVLAMSHSYTQLMAGACFLGLDSSVFHPEASGVARVAAGGRHGLAQSVFQLGGNIGSAVGPLAAAPVVARRGQSSMVYFALMTLLSTAILWNVDLWYGSHGSERRDAVSPRLKSQSRADAPLPVRPLLILLVLIFSRFVYVASLTNYYTFYLIDRFHSSVFGAQLHLFVFLAALALGTVLGGYWGDRLGGKRVIWFSILAALPFTLLLPFANLFWPGPLTVLIGLLLASAFPAIVVYGQELLPNRVGMVSGLLFGFSFGMAGLGAASLGGLADLYGIRVVYQIRAFLPVIGLFAAFLPDARVAEADALPMIDDGLTVMPARLNRYASRRAAAIFLPAGRGLLF